MPGMHMGTGRAVADIEHLRQSISDILTTPMGTRIERRTYGSMVPDLIDLFTRRCRQAGRHR